MFSPRYTSRMSHGNRFRSIALCCSCALSCAATTMAQSTHYSVKLAPDFEHQLLKGDETIEVQADAGEVEWQKQAGLRVMSANVADGDVTVNEHAVRVRLRSGGKHILGVKYTASAGGGMRWVASAVPLRADSSDSGFSTALYWEEVFVSSTTHGYRATSR